VKLRAPVLTLSFFFYKLCFWHAREGHTSRHPGNTRHNELVFHGVLEWLDDDTNDGPSWSDTVDRIWTEIWLAGGRYLRWDDSDGSWIELHLEDILDTIDKAMRSRLQWFRTMDMAHPKSQEAVVTVERLDENNDYRLGIGGEAIFDGAVATLMCEMSCF
jgi:hypothetical protein